MSGNDPKPHAQSNPLGNTSLALGIASVGLFGGRSRQTAALGLVLGFVSLCGFIAVLGALGGG